MIGMLLYSPLVGGKEPPSVVCGEPYREQRVRLIFYPFSCRTIVISSERSIKSGGKTQGHPFEMIWLPRRVL